MTSLSHLDPSFGSVFAIEAINEPIMNTTLTPGYGDCMHLQGYWSIRILMLCSSPDELC